MKWVFSRGAKSLGIRLSLRVSSTVESTVKDAGNESPNQECHGWFAMCENMTKINFRKEFCHEVGFLTQRKKSWNQVLVESILHSGIHCKGCREREFQPRMSWLVRSVGKIDENRF